MSNDDTYQGWTNRETWAAVLHLNNDQGMQEMARERLAESDEISHPRVMQGLVEELIEDFAAEVDGIAMMRDEIGSMWRVNWAEVAEALAGEV